MSAVPQRGEATALWLQQPAWAARKIPDQDAGGGWFLLLFALFWNGIAWAVTIMMWHADPRIGVQHFFVLLFPLIGILVMAGAIYSLVRRSRYGVPLFELATLPAPLGRVLAGHVKVERGLPPASKVDVVLKAIHQTVIRSGKSNATREEIVWEHRRTLPGALESGAGVTIPIAFAIPREAPETTLGNSRDRILWRLEVTSAVAGVDFSARFEVPVFYTPESDTPLTPEELARIG
jgi:hypothetical protein